MAQVISRRAALASVLATAAGVPNIASAQQSGGVTAADARAKLADTKLVSMPLSELTKMLSPNIKTAANSCDQKGYCLAWSDYVLVVPSKEMGKAIKTFAPGTSLKDAMSEIEKSLGPSASGTIRLGADGKFTAFQKEK